MTLKQAAFPELAVPDRVALSPASLAKPRSYVERVAAYFKERPSEWIDGMALAEVGGIYAWRSRISELRRAPFEMVIENRERKTTSGHVVSEYRWVP